jgi:hypothetical protein
MGGGRGNRYTRTCRPPLAPKYPKHSYAFRRRKLRHFSVEGTQHEDLTLKEAALESGYIDEKRFGEIVDPKKMVGHGVAGS